MGKLNFMNKYPFLSKISQRSLMSLLYGCKIKKYIKDDILFKENDKVEHLYLVAKGSIEIS